jgi:beta-N-acetylhexosaminidase
MPHNFYSIEEIAGQRMIVGFDGTHLNDDLKFLIGDLNVGGLILFSRNIEAPAQLRELCFSIHAHAKACGRPPLFIAIDQEGGEVARLKPPFTVFPGNPKMMGIADAIAFAHACATELADAGINMNFAPVMDIAFPFVDSVMKGRAFGANPEWAAVLGTTVIDELQRNGIMAVAKHFPGIGRTTLDSHKDLPVLATPGDMLRKTDLVPFRAAVRRDVAGVMLAHILYQGLDPEWPASLSSVIVKKLLRGEMGYQGVVMTDDLDMGAIRKHYDIDVCVSRIMEANIDLVMICHKGPDIERSFDLLCDGMKNSEILLEMGRRSVERIMGLKNRYLRISA